MQEIKGVETLPCLNPKFSSIKMGTWSGKNSSRPDKGCKMKLLKRVTASNMIKNHNKESRKKREYVVLFCFTWISKNQDKIDVRVARSNI